MQKYLLGFIFITLGWGLFEGLRDNMSLPTYTLNQHSLTLPDIQLPSITPLAMSDFNAIVTRPIFFAERQLPSSIAQHRTNIVTSHPTFKKTPPSVRLTAILAGHQGQRIALFLSDRGIDHKLVLGDILGGWRLSDIDKDSVTFKANQQSHLFTLYDFSTSDPIINHQAWYIR